MLLYSSSNMSRKISSPCVDSDIEKTFKNKRKRGQKINTISIKENHFGWKAFWGFFFCGCKSVHAECEKKQHSICKCTFYRRYMLSNTLYIILCLVYLGPRSTSQCNDILLLLHTRNRKYCSQANITSLCMPCHNKHAIRSTGHKSISSVNSHQKN